MSEPPQFSWCPPRFLDLPSGGTSSQLRVQPDGTVVGLWEIWYIPPKIDVDRGVVRPSQADESVRNQVQQAPHNREQCVILTASDFGSQGLVVD